MTPVRFRSTRFAEFELRAAFMRAEVASKARRTRADNRPWSRFFRS